MLAPYPGPSVTKPRVQHAQKEEKLPEKLPELKEIEDNDEEDRVAWVSFGLDKDF